MSLKEIKECCVVAKPDNILGEKPILFISVANNKIENSETLIKNLNKVIQEKLSGYHQPEEIYFYQNLPKTKSGKIMRRIMKNLAYELIIEENKDYSTLANPSKFEESAFLFFKEKVDELTKNKFILSFKKEDSHANLNFHLLNLQIIELINRSEKFENLNQIKICIEDKECKKIIHEIDLKKSLNLKNLYQNLAQSPIDKSILNFKRALIRFSNRKDLDISLIMKRISEDEINFDLLENKALPKEKIFLKKDIIDSLENFRMQNFIIPNAKKQFDENRLETNNKAKISCFKCMATLKEMGEQRKRDVYFISVIRLDGRQAYICDLCAQGW